ncbi:MAG TPA: TrmJ/YjtD family RNA methyltransferase [Longimicrobiales bacterium]
MTDRAPSGRAAALANIVIVLNETQDLVNIAGAVRAMMNMGLRRMRLVRPAEFDAYRIAGIAHGSEAIIERIEFFDTLRDAVADAAHVVGTTARRRTAAYVWQHPREAAPELLRIALEGQGPVAIVFGREDKGLSNEELDLCDRALTVPTDPEHWSLNLAQAVLLVAYELRMAGPAARAPLPTHRKAAPRRANAEEMQRLFAATEDALHIIEFFKKRNPEAIMRSVRAIARRADLDSREAGLLRAMAIEVRKFFERVATRR